MKINKRGESWTGDMAAIVAHLIIAVMIIVFALVIGMKFGWILGNTADEQSTIESFRRIGNKVSEILVNVPLYEDTKVTGVSISKGYVVVAFSSGANRNVEAGILHIGTGRSGGEPNPIYLPVSMTFKKPDQCQEKACICLFEDVSLSSSGEYSDSDMPGNAPCLQFKKDLQIQFISFPYSRTQTHLQGKALPASYSTPYSSEIHTIYEDVLKNPRVFVEAQDKYLDLAYVQSVVGDGNNQKVFIDKFGDDKNGYTILISDAEIETEQRVANIKEKSKIDPCVPDQVNKDPVTGDACACGTKVAMPVGTTSYKNYCCKSDGRAVASSYFLYWAPCHCWFDNINECGDYRDLNSCETDDCLVGTQRPCKWMDYGGPIEDGVCEENFL